MGDRFTSIGDEHRKFIEGQQMFFVATAAPGSRVNLSPKGGDCLRVVDANRVVWLNLTGSGNETAAHVPLDPRMTLMFCSFDQTPLILRLYGQVKVLHARDEGWARWSGLFAEHMGARQIFEMDVELVQASCGFSVPRYYFLEHRPTLDKWTENQGPEGIGAFWRETNQVSLDGLPTHLLPDGE